MAEEKVLFEKCPVCETGKVKKTTVKGFLSLLGTKEKIQCDNRKCGATWERKGTNEFGLVPSARFVNRYEGETLTLREWKRIAEGGLSDAEEQLEEIKSGNLPIVPAEQLDIILKRSEVAHLQGQVEYWEERMVRKHAGYYGGPSFRVAKGISWRMGGFKGQSRSYPELRHVDTGNMVLTSQRLIFTGQFKSFTIPLNKIVSLKVKGKGDLEISKEGREKSYHLFCNADLVKLFILGAIKKTTK